jgi:hypothetical protein
VTETPDAGGGQGDEGHDRNDRRDFGVRVAGRDEPAGTAEQGEAAPDKIPNPLDLPLLVNNRHWEVLRI